MEANQIRLKTESFDLHAAVEDVVALATPAAEEKGLRLFLARARSAPDWVLGDSARLKQIITNFVANAIKFSDSGEIRVEVDCAETDDPARPELRISVADQGIGLRPEDREVIFHRFNQLDGSETRTRQGIGLGLAICVSLAELMGGRVSVESTFGEGSTFTFAVQMDRIDALRLNPPLKPFRAAVLDASPGRRAALEGRLKARGACIDDDRPDITFAVLDAKLDPPEAVLSLLKHGPVQGAVAAVLPMSGPLAAHRQLTIRSVHPDVAILAQPATDHELEAVLAQVAKVERSAV